MGSGQGSFTAVKGRALFQSSEWKWNTLIGQCHRYNSCSFGEELQGKKKRGRRKPGSRIQSLPLKVNVNSRQSLLKSRLHTRPFSNFSFNVCFYTSNPFFFSYWKSIVPFITSSWQSVCFSHCKTKLTRVHISTAHDRESDQSSLGWIDPRVQMNFQTSPYEETNAGRFKTDQTVLVWTV